MPVVATTADSAIACPSCGGYDVGAAWSAEGKLRMIWCHDCRAVTMREPIEPAPKAGA